MWYSSSALRYFLPCLENRKALMRGPSFLNASFVGAKNVPPTCGVSASVLKRPVCSRPSCRVLKTVGRWLIIGSVGGGGSRMAFRP